MRTRDAPAARARATYSTTAAAVRAIGGLAEDARRVESLAQARHLLLGVHRHPRRPGMDLRDEQAHGVGAEIDDAEAPDVGRHDADARTPR